MNPDTVGHNCETALGENGRYQRHHRANIEAGSAPIGSTKGLLADRGLIDIAYEDYLQRIELGGDVDLGEFCKCYPELEGELRCLLALDQVFGDKPSLLLGCVDGMWPHSGDEFAGFELVEELGRGAFARVFRARETKLGDRDVALKVCCCGAHEAWVLGKLKHRNIVPVHGVYDDEDLGLSAICMPYLGRVTLRNSVTRAWQSGAPQGKISNLASEGRKKPTGTKAKKPGFQSRGHRIYLDEVLRIGSQIAEALAYAHSEGVYHLDLKPANILVDEKGCPQLLDFNLSFERNHGVPRVGGTLPYMAPEQAQFFLAGGSDAQLDGRCDIYSLGVILSEMLHGSLPFGKVSRSLSSRSAAQELLTRQQCRAPGTRQNDGTEPRLSAIIDKCLAFEPQDRYQSAADLAKDLRRELTIHRSVLRWCRSHRSQLVAFFGVVALLSAGWAFHLANRAPYPFREYRSGASHLKAREYQDAIDHFTRSLEADPQQAYALAARGEAYMGLEHYHDAIRDFKAAGKIAKTGRQLALFGYCCNCVGSHASTLVIYKEAIQRGYDSTAVLNNFGFACHLRSQDQRAITLLNAAVKKGDHLATTLYNRAVVYLAIDVKEGREPLNAMADIDRALLEGADTALAYHCAAAIYGYAGSFDKSLKVRAAQYGRLALKRGISPQSIATNPFLAPLFADHAFPIASTEPNDFEREFTVCHFVQPQ
jgi:serine/threonine protein kinase